MSLLKLGLADELRIMVHPIILGAGRSVFQGSANRISTQLVRSRPFESGNVLQYYQPVDDRN